MKKIVAALVLADSFAAQPAMAATIEYTSAGLLSSLNGSFDYNYDAASDALTITRASAQIGSITLTDFVVSEHFIGSRHIVTIGTPAPYDPFRPGLTPGTESYALFDLTFDPATQKFNTDFFGAKTNYSFTGSDGLTFGAPFATFAEVPAAVPEPASWMIMLVGFGAIGATLRRRRSVVLTAQSA